MLPVPAGTAVSVCLTAVHTDMAPLPLDKYSCLLSPIKLIYSQYYSSCRSNNVSDTFWRDDVAVACTLSLCRKQKYSFVHIHGKALSDTVWF